MQTPCAAEHNKLVSREYNDKLGATIDPFPPDPSPFHIIFDPPDLVTSSPPHIQPSSSTDIRKRAWGGSTGGISRSAKRAARMALVG
jgi:hypothetical protein